MKTKSFLSLSLVLIALVAFSGCSMFGGGGTPTNPTPTLPLPTNVVLETSAPGSTSAAPSGETFIGGNIFIDANASGKQDEGDATIAGVVVQIATGDCPGTALGQTTSTAETPSYKFTGLAQGTYCVSIDAASPQNAAILGQGAWTFPQPAQGVITDPVKLGKRSKDNASFGWTFATLGTVTPDPNQPPAQPGQPTQEPLLPTPTAFVEPTPSTGGQPLGCSLGARFIQDVTIPDGQRMLPNTQFVKTWSVQNTGTCAWGPGSPVQNLQFVGGEPLGAQNLVPLSTNIAAGATGNISINMIAPAQAGTYKSSWKLRADDGTLFGVGPSNVALYALITVEGPPAPTAVPPAQPTQAPSAPAQPITMAPGATEAEAQGQLQAGGIATYSISAQEGQNMALSLSSNSSSARVAVLSPTGVPLPPQRGNPEGTYWQGNLPVNGNYIVQVLAGNAAPTANYSLNVTIPVRINFAPGAISATEQGTTSNGRIVTYLLKANGGQTMTVNLQAPPNSAGITIYGLEDGQPLIRSQSGATSFNGQLPATQDYVIQVVPFGNGQVNYTLMVTVQ